VGGQRYAHAAEGVGEGMILSPDTFLQKICEKTDRERREERREALASPSVADESLMAVDANTRPGLIPEELLQELHDSIGGQCVIVPGKTVSKTMPVDESRDGGTYDFGVRAPVVTIGPRLFPLRIRASDVRERIAELDKWVEIREPHTDKLLFRFHPVRDLIEIQRRGAKTLIDLSEYRK